MGRQYQESVDAIRVLSIDAVERANSGHPGLPMGAAPMAYALWRFHLNIDPAAHDWWNRDRFVLSAGHGSMLLYSLLHLANAGLSMDDIRDFRQLDSLTPGHPESFITAGVEATTGPLGQGTANAVGMAMAERYMANRYNRPGFALFDHYTYALVSDGDLMEGVAAEAAAIAGHLGLGRLVYLYDANDVTLDGPAEMAFTEDIGSRYAAVGWHVQTVADGDDNVDAIVAAIDAAKKETDKPSLIIVKTTIGYGSPNKGGKSASHGSPLGSDEVAAVRQQLGWSHAPFDIPDTVYQDFAQIASRGGKLRTAWQSSLAEYKQAHPELAGELSMAFAGEVPSDAVPTATQEVGASVATRSASGALMQDIAKHMPWFVGGDADLGCSTKTLIKDGEDFAGSGAGRNIRYGVREHAMASISNGMAYHGGIRPYAATFFVFSDYMRPAVRLAAMNGLPITYLWTHDSVGLGEDGPTHQPVEHLMSLRAMPGLSVIRPADANEVAAAWRYILARNDGPSALVLSRQNLPVLAGSDACDVAKGAYVIAPENGALQAIVIATGSEVSVAVAAAASLNDGGIGTRVVSMPCWEAFAVQSQDYQDQVLPPSVSARVSIEAGVTLGWTRWVGAGRAIGVDRFGLSAPGPTALAQVGITEDAVVAAVKQQLETDEQ